MEKQSNREKERDRQSTNVVRDEELDNLREELDAHKDLYKQQVIEMENSYISIGRLQGENESLTSQLQEAADARDELRRLLMVSLSRDCPGV